MIDTSLPIFSIVVPVFNVDKYITRCIDSILEQSFTSFEVICVNDGSTDYSIRLLEQYDDPRIRIIHQKNMGLSAARNTGIYHSSGIYIALLDADDLWRSDKLARHLKHMSHNPSVDISYAPSLFINEDGSSLGIGQFPKLTDITPPEIFCRNPVGNGSAAVMSRKFLTRLALKQNHCPSSRVEFFDESLKQSEDIEFWLRAALEIDVVFEGINHTLTFYRLNSKGLSADLSKQYASWQSAMKNLATRHPAFFHQWYSLADAYQKRYLARRAIQSGQAPQALSWFTKAILSNSKIVQQEPSRTLLTFAASFASLLPKVFLKPLENLTLHLMKTRTEG